MDGEASGSWELRGGGEAPLWFSPPGRLLILMYEQLGGKECGT